MEKSILNETTKQQLELDYIAVGLSSDVGRGKHVLMLDLDNYSYERVFDAVKELISFYSLSDAYIIRSSEHNWHVLFLDIINDYETAKTMVEPYVDGRWLEMCDKRREFVIRVSPRLIFQDGKVVITDVLQFFTVALSPYHYCYQKSNAHRLAFDKAFGVKVKMHGNYDNGHATKMVMYTMGRPVDYDPKALMHSNIKGASPSEPKVPV
jgi:hypothetical protein